MEIEVDGDSIFVMFDPVHAAKSMRNNLVDKNLELEYRDSEKVKGFNRKFAFWDHLETAYDMDQHGDSLFKLMPKLTPAHIQLIIFYLRISYLILLMDKQWTEISL